MISATAITPQDGNVRKYLAAAELPSMQTQYSGLMERGKHKKCKLETVKQ